jgi:hypothetical protein
MHSSIHRRILLNFKAQYTLVFVSFLVFFFFGFPTFWPEKYWRYLSEIHIWCIKIGSVFVINAKNITFLETRHVRRNSAKGENQYWKCQSKRCRQGMVTSITILADITNILSGPKAGSLHTLIKGVNLSCWLAIPTVNHVNRVICCHSQSIENDLTISTGWWGQGNDCWSRNSGGWVNIDTYIQKVGSGA